MPKNYIGIICLDRLHLTTGVSISLERLLNQQLSLKHPNRKKISFMSFVITYHSHTMYNTDSMITPQNIMRHELVGLEVKIIHSLHGNSERIKGKVVNETKKTFTIEDGAGNEKIIPKGSATFQFKLPEGITVEIEGKIIISRPEDRIKKRFRKYW